ncbi:hypothetical protein GJ496_000847 [Pomphorhynchus laevis]|nr:hypothetical protein GJ496_000847 [Pomphorhynchus laevis]
MPATSNRTCTNCSAPNYTSRDQMINAHTHDPNYITNGITNVQTECTHDLHSVVEGPTAENYLRNMGSIHMLTLMNVSHQFIATLAYLFLCASSSADLETIHFSWQQFSVKAFERRLRMWHNQELHESYREALIMQKRMEYRNINENNNTAPKR